MSTNRVREALGWAGRALKTIGGNVRTLSVSDRVHSNSRLVLAVVSDLSSNTKWNLLKTNRICENQIEVLLFVCQFGSRSSRSIGHQQCSAIYVCLWLSLQACSSCILDSGLSTRQFWWNLFVVRERAVMAGLPSVHWDYRSYLAKNINMWPFKLQAIIPALHFFLFQ